MLFCFLECYDNNFSWHSEPERQVASEAGRYAEQCLGGCVIIEFSAPFVIDILYRCPSANRELCSVSMSCKSNVRPDSRQYVLLPCIRVVRQEEGECLRNGMTQIFLPYEGVSKKEKICHCVIKY